MSLNRQVILLLVVLCFGCSYADEAEWKYLDPTSTEELGTLRISEAERVIVFDEHVGHRWTDCDPKDEENVVCFESPQLYMKLPRAALGESEWTQDGVVFSVRLHKEFRLLGQDIGDVYVVSTEGVEKRGFVYSPDRGVIAIFFGHDEWFGVPMVMGKCGYAAPPACYDR